MMRNRLRWLPAIVVPALIAAGVVAANASGNVELPQRSPAEVLALAAGHTDASFSGTVEQESALGLPELPTEGPPGVPEASEALEWLSGSHSVRVYADGPTKARFQVLDRLAERDVVVNGSDVWLYDSREKTAVHTTVPAERGHPLAGQVNPVDLAERLLTRLDPSTEVSLGSNRKVAGRAAYELVLTPKTADTLVGFVSIAVDGETGMPLGVSVLARGQNNPSMSVAFTGLSLEAPEAALFEFSPPPGTTVTEHPVPTGKPGSAPETSDLPHHGDKPELADPADPIISGEDWTTVVELPADSAPADLFESPLYAELTTAVDGGRLLSTALLNILITDDGRVLVGAVPVHLLQAATATQ